ncbi:hypothetical protein HAZT_HAZT006541 [Hyalella azteca]|nr:hypothetical protein HAZT_HAZT006541 [Hyalella azteca]
MHQLQNLEGCPTSSMSVQCAGHVLQPHDVLPTVDSTITVMLTLPGGKGGFGSMLRAIGAQIEKTTNKEACRDLSGRRLRDINQEKKLKEALQKRAEKERERIANRKKKFEALKETPKHIFSDSTFHQEQEEITSALFQSVEKGLQVAAKESSPCSSSISPQSSSAGSDDNETKDSQKITQKRKLSKEENIQKLKKGRFYDDLDESSDESD